MPQLQAQSLTFDTALTAGINRGAESWLRGLATDAQGNVYVGGYFAGTISFGSQQFKGVGSQYNSFVAKYNADGELLWARQVDPNSYQRILALAVDAQGNVYVGGDYTGTARVGTQTLIAQSNASGQELDIFVAKLDATGAWQWAIGAGSSGPDRCSNLAISPGGQLVMSGEFGGPAASFGPYQLTNLNPAAAATGYSPDVYVAKLSPAGTWLSVLQAGGPGNDAAAGMAVDAAGAVYLCGSYGSGPVQFGTDMLSTSNSYDAYVAKLDAAGSWDWATSLGSPSGLAGLALDASGRPYIVGSFSVPTLTIGATTLANTGSGNADILVAALTTDGHWRWATSAGGPGIDLASGLAVAPSGQLTVVGQFYSRQLILGSSGLVNQSDAGNGEAYVGQLDANGTWLAGLTPLGAGEKDAWRVAIAPDGNTYVAGNYWSPQAQFGAVTLTGIGVFPTCFLAHVARTADIPFISTFTPASAAPGQTITLQGTNFVDVRSVRFNGVPAAFQVQSATQLTATVPADATPGRVQIRTASAFGSSQLPFAATTLASTANHPPEELQVWPNPVVPASALHVQLPTGLATASPTRAELRNSLGQLVASTEFRGTTLDWPLQLPAGLYQLMVRPAGLAAIHLRLAVAQ